MLNNSVCPIISNKRYITSSCYIQITHSRDQIQHFGKYSNSLTRWRGSLRPCATTQKVAVSIPNGVIGIFDIILPAALWP